MLALADRVGHLSHPTSLILNLITCIQSFSISLYLDLRLIWKLGMSDRSREYLDQEEAYSSFLTLSLSHQVWFKSLSYEPLTEGFQRE